MELSSVAEFMGSLFTAAGWLAAVGFISFVMSKMLFLPMTGVRLELLAPREFQLVDGLVLLGQCQVLWAVLVASIPDWRLTVWLVMTLTGTVAIWWWLALSLLKTAAVSRTPRRLLFLAGVAPVGFLAGWLCGGSLVAIPVLLTGWFAGLRLAALDLSLAAIAGVVALGLPVEALLAWGIHRLTARWFGAPDVARQEMERLEEGDPAG